MLISDLFQGRVIFSNLFNLALNTFKVISYEASNMRKQFLSVAKVVLLILIVVTRTGKSNRRLITHLNYQLRETQDVFKIDQWRILFTITIMHKPCIWLGQTYCA